MAVVVGYRLLSLSVAVEQRRPDGKTVAPRHVKAAPGRRTCLRQAGSKLRLLLPWSRDLGFALRNERNEQEPTNNLQCLSSGLWRFGARCSVGLVNLRFHLRDCQPRPASLKTPDRPGEQTQATRPRGLSLSGESNNPDSPDVHRRTISQTHPPGRGYSQRLTLHFPRMSRCHRPAKCEPLAGAHVSSQHDHQCGNHKPPFPANPSTRHQLPPQEVLGATHGAEKAYRLCVYGAAL
jgi:hypothetical protein